ncbi:MAG TPA: MFS transporter, partial [Beijerinckiaceae bacterium]|nr:MFS transporter [Beijerinckiaceae bacterium]
GPSLAGRGQIATASAVVSISLNVTRFIGPLIAAPLLVLGLEPLAFAVAAVGFATNTYCLSQISRDESAAASVAAGTEEGASVSYATVMRDMLSSAPMRAVLGLQLLTSLLVRPIIDMFPAFADQVFGRAEGGFGMLSAAVGCGAIAGAAYLVGQPAGRAMHRHIVSGSFLFVAMGLLFAYCTNFWAALIVLLIFGLAMTTSGVASTTYVQAQTPMHRLGRVMSIYSVIARLAPAIGALVLGASADQVGLAPAVTVFSLLAFCAVAMAARSLRVA